MSLCNVALHWPFKWFYAAGNSYLMAQHSPFSLLFLKDIMGIWMIIQSEIIFYCSVNMLP